MSKSNARTNETVGMGEAPRLLPVSLPALAASILATALAPRAMAFEAR